MEYLIREIFSKNKNTSGHGLNLSLTGSGRICHWYSANPDLGLKYYFYTTAVHRRKISVTRKEKMRMKKCYYFRQLFFQVNLGQPVLPRVFILYLFRNRTSGIIWELIEKGFLKAGRPSCDPAISVKSIKGTQRNTLTSGLAFFFLISYDKYFINVQVVGRRCSVRPIFSSPTVMERTSHELRAACCVACP